MTMENMTVRQQIRELLGAGPISAREISQEVHISEKEVYEHLEHLQRSLAASNKTLQLHPPVCLHCGYVFHERKRLKPPGNCPKCRNTRIRRPLYSISSS